MDYEAALAYLSDHISEAWVLTGKAPRPTLHEMRRLVELMGDPQLQYPVIHLTGTNGKTSTARMVAELLVAKGLSVGTLTSPHLERLNERIAWNGELIADGALAEALSAVADIEPLLGEDRPRYFEVVAAAAFRWFADVAVDVAVVEVGLGGRWDATNVTEAQVAVVTGVGLDHAEIIGPTVADIAREKAGIVKPGSTLILGEIDGALVPIFRDAGAAVVWQRGVDFACTENRIAHGGRMLDLRTPGAVYEGVFLPIHGAHQGDNAACALAAAEAFFAQPLTEQVVVEAFGRVTSPGRLEVVGHRPLCILDGVKNPDGARSAVAAIREEFGEYPAVLVVGLLKGKDPEEMLTALDAKSARVLIACEPRDPRARPSEEVAAAAREIGVPQVEDAKSVEAALARAFELASPDDAVLVTGSLYVVGAARPILSRR